MQMSERVICGRLIKQLYARAGPWVSRRGSSGGGGRDGRTDRRRYKPRTENLNNEPLISKWVGGMRGWARDGTAREANVSHFLC